MNIQEKIDEAESHKLNNKLDEAISLWRLVVDVYPDTDQGRYAVKQLKKYQPFINKKPKKSTGMFSFEGRINRSTYWPTIISLLIVIAVVTFGIQYVLAASASQAISNSFALLDLLFTILVTWILLATYVKRCHDINMSGWLVLLAIIPFVNLLVLLYLGIAPGTSGANKYGEESQ